MSLATLFKAGLAGAVLVAAAPAFAQDAMSAWIDGRLSAAESQALSRARFAQADADRNGTMTAAEFTALSLADFDRADRNRDGVITRGEVRGLAPTADTSALGQGFTRTQAGQLATTRFGQLDANRNGAVPLDEYLARLASEFQAADVNRDGFISRGELRGLAAAAPR